MRKFTAVMAICLVLLSIGVVLVDAKSIEKSDECARRCAIEYPPHLYPNQYYDCYIICFDGPPQP